MLEASLVALLEKQSKGVNRSAKEGFWDNVWKATEFIPHVADHIVANADTPRLGTAVFAGMAIGTVIKKIREAQSESALEANGCKLVDGVETQSSCDGFQMLFMLESQRLL